MDEDDKRSWDVRLGIVGPIITVAGLLLGVWQFTAGEKHNVALEYTPISRNQQVEFERQLWLQRLATYRAMAELSGKMSAETDNPKAFDALARQFTATYWGASVLFEDDRVERAMMDFNLAIHDFRNHTLNTNGLKVKGFALMKACQASINERHPAP